MLDSVIYLRETVGRGTKLTSSTANFSKYFENSIIKPFDCDDLNDQIHIQDLGGLSQWDSQLLFNLGYHNEQVSLVIDAPLATINGWMKPSSVYKAQFRNAEGILYKAIAFSVRKDEDKRLGAYKLYLRIAAEDTWSMYDEEPSLNRKGIPSQEVYELKASMILFQKVETDNLSKEADPATNFNNLSKLKFTNFEDNRMTPAVIRLIQYVRGALKRNRTSKSMYDFFHYLYNSLNSVFDCKKATSDLKGLGWGIGTL